MDVTLLPHAFSSTPMLLAVTPFPSPLTTPPVTRTYFIAAAAASLVWCFGRLLVSPGAEISDGTPRGLQACYYSWLLFLSGSRSLNGSGLRSGMRRTGSCSAARKSQTQTMAINRCNCENGIAPCSNYRNAELMHSDGWQ